MDPPLWLLVPWLVFAIGIGLKAWKVIRLLNRQCAAVLGGWNGSEQGWRGTGSGVSRCDEAAETPGERMLHRGMARRPGAGSPQSTETVPRRLA
jgi:hypothetical protein